MPNSIEVFRRQIVKQTVTHDFSIMRLFRAVYENNALRQFIIISKDSTMPFQFKSIPWFQNCNKLWHGQIFPLYSHVITFVTETSKIFSWLVSYWLLLQEVIIQSVPRTATIFWSIVRPHMSSNHSWFIHQSSMENTRTDI
jgi:hypothetical protein